MIKKTRHNYESEWAELYVLLDINTSLQTRVFPGNLLH